MLYIVIGIVIASFIAYLFLQKTDNKPNNSSKPKDVKQNSKEEENQAQERNIEIEKKDDQPSESKETNEPFSFSQTSYALPNIKILFGTQKGTAERFSRILEEQAKEKGFKTVEVVDLEEYDFDEITSEELVIFIVATYIEGT